MSIFRTIKKIRDCDTCMGTGKIWSDGEEIVCDDCKGEGKVEVFSRVSQSAAARASSSAKSLPPHERAAVRERLEDHEPPSEGAQEFPKGKKHSKVGKDFVEEE